MIRLSAVVLCALSLTIATASETAASEVRVSGRVLLPDGSPARGATVRAVPFVGYEGMAEIVSAGRLRAEAADEVSAGEDGRWVLRVEAGCFRIVAELDGHESRAASLVPIVDDRMLEDVRLGEGTIRELTVSLPDGAPASGAVLRVEPERERSRSPWRAWTDPIRADEKGRLTVTVAGELRGEAVHPAATLWSGRVPTSGEIRLGEKAERRLRIVDARGGGVSAASVWFGDGALLVGRSGEDGEAVVPVPATGEGVHLAIVGPDGARRDVQVALGEDDDSPVLVELPTTVTVDGRVLDGEIGDPLPGALVFAAPHRTTRADAAGGFRLEGVSAERAWARAAARGYMETSERIHLVDGVPEGETTLRLERVGWLPVVVLDSAGEPVSDAEVSVNPMNRRRPTEERYGRTDGNGAVRMGPVPTEGDLEISVRAEGFALLERRETLPRAEGAGPVVLELSAGRQGFGRVVDVAERPLAGAEVGLRRRATGDFRQAMWRDREEEAVATTTSDAEGAFSMPFLPHGTFDLAVRRAGSAPLDVPGLEIAEAEDAELDLGVLVLGPEAVIEGRVVDRAGAPRAGASVEVRKSEAQGWWGGRGRSDATTGGDGRFRVGERTPGEDVDLFVTLEGFTTASRRGVSLPAEEPLEIVLEPSPSVAGIVVDEAGRGIEGADVFAAAERRLGGGYSTTTAGEARTDSNGRFEIGELEFAGTTMLAVRADGYQEAHEEIELLPGQRLEGLRIELGVGLRLVGRVVDEDGTGIAEAFVRVEPRGGGQWRGRTPWSQSDGAGRFVLEGMEPGRHRLLAHAEGHAATTVEVEARASGPEIEIVLSTGRRISGLVLDAEGAPAAGATVRVVGDGGRFVGTVERAGPDGRFEVSGLADGAWSLVASHETLGVGSVEILAEGEDVSGVTVELSPGGRAYGRILGAELASLAEATVFAFGTGNRTVGTVDWEGRWSVEGLAPGSWAVLVSIDGRSLQAQVEVGPGEEVEYDFDLEEGVAITGVVLHRGEPVSGAALLLSGDAGSGHAVTNHEGRFRAEGFEPGEVDIEVVVADRGLRGARTVRVGDVDLETVVEIDQTAVEGRVTDAETGQPIGGATVTARRSGEGPRFTDATDHSGADGTFLLRGVSAGTVEITVQRGGYAPWRGVAEVAPGSTLDVGTVELETGAPLRLRLLPPTSTGVRVHVFDVSGGRAGQESVQPDASGLVTVESVPPGTWSLQLVTSGRATVWVHVTVPSPEPVEVGLPLPSSVRVEIPELRAAGEAASIQAFDERGRRHYPFGSAEKTGLPFVGGTAEVGALAPGRWRIVVTAPDGRTWEDSITTRPGATGIMVLE